MKIKKILLDVVRDRIRFKHYSIKTEKSYTSWIKHYIFYHNKKHPIEMAKPEIEQFLTYLAVERKVSPSTQNKTFSALLFLYKEVPQVLTKEEVKKVIDNLTRTYQLIVYLMYGCGLRMSEALNIRIKDIDLGLLVVPFISYMHS